MSRLSNARPAVRVAGIGETGPVREDPRSIPEMVLDAVERALADAGLGFDDVDSVVTASVDLFDGLTASNVAITEVVGAVMKPETRIAADGLCAAVHAACQIWAEAYETVLVVAHGKASMAPQQSLTAWALDPIYLQPLGMDFEVCAGLQARAVAAGDPGAEQRWAETVVARRKSAGEGALARPCTVDDVLSSPIVASPLRREMCAPLGDAACAAVLRKAEPFGEPSRSVFLAAAGHDLSPHAPGDRDLSSWDGLARACARAYAGAGIQDPGSSFDLAEPSCLYPHEEELFLKAAGLKESVSCSPDGGLLAGAAPVAAGLLRLASAVKRVREVESFRRAIVHGAWGPAGQGQVVAVLEAGA